MKSLRRRSPPVRIRRSTSGAELPPCVTHPAGATSVDLRLDIIQQDAKDRFPRRIIERNTQFQHAAGRSETLSRFDRVHKGSGNAVAPADYPQPDSLRCAFMSFRSKIIPDSQAAVTRRTDAPSCARRKRRG